MEVFVLAKIKKSDIDLNTTLVNLRLILKGFRQELVIYTTATECCEFVDVLNQNRFNKMGKAQREMMENKYYTFTDYKRKSTITVSLPDVKVFEIPFFFDNDDEWDFKILTYKQ